MNEKIPLRKEWTNDLSQCRDEIAGYEARLKHTTSDNIPCLKYLINNAKKVEKQLMAKIQDIDNEIKDHEHEQLKDTHA